MRLKLILIIAVVIALPIAAQAGSHKATNGHKVKTELRMKSQSTVNSPKVDTLSDSYSLTR